VLIVLLTLFGFSYGPYANHLPLGVHNWAQSDRFSVAVMYMDNINFFKAQTHNLSTIDGRCGVEFPAVQYLSARISALTSPQHLPIIYRSINLLILLAGIWFFVRSWKVDSTVKLLAGLILFFSPVLFFYGFNFLPDTIGLGVLLIGLGYFIRFTTDQKQKYAIYSLLFAGLATLLKTTCGIYFLALAGCYGLHYLKPFALKKGLHILGILALIILVVVGYDYYFFHNVNADFYSRVFMSKQQPITSYEDFRGLLKGFKYWHGQYMTWPQTLLLTSLITSIFINRKRLSSNALGNRYLIISLVGLIAFLGLMGKQFINHDYYFITSVLPIYSIAIWLLITSQSNVKLVSGKAFKGILLVLMVWSAFLSISDYGERMSSHFIWKNRDIITDIEWMQNGEAIIDELGIKQNETIFIGYDAAPNTSLVYFNRMGKAFNHEEMSRDSDNMMYWSQRIQPSYYIFPNNWAPNLAQDQAWLYARLVPFAKRDKFTIYKPLNYGDEQSTLH
jgi:hypothetical protein